VRSRLTANPKSTSWGRNTSYNVQIVTIGPPVFEQITLLPNALKFYCLQWKKHSLKVPLPVSICTPSNTWLLGPTRLSILNGFSIGSAVFAPLTADSPYTL